MAASTFSKRRPDDMMTAAAAAVVAARPSPGRVRVHGHPAWGAVSGLFLGVGLAVLGQQYALWPLTVVTAIAFPVYAGALGGVRGWLGRPYKAEFRSRHDST